MMKPNFFVVGAPKCGTTALTEYLRTHPNVFVTTPKEPEYFAEDLPRYRLVRTQEQYGRLFSKCSDQHKARGEASTGYLFSSAAIPRIREVYPEAKIIAMLRNPVEMVYAWHAQAIVDGDETERDFRKAWDLQSERAQGRLLPKGCRHQELLQYREWALYAGQIERLYSCFPERQVRVIIFDDFKSSTKQVYEDVLAFLDVPSDDRNEFPRINENRTVRCRALGRFMQIQPGGLWEVGHFLRRMLGVERLWVLELLRQLNWKMVPRPLMDPEFRAQLVEEFREDVLRLSDILERDLGHWLESPVEEGPPAGARLSESERRV